MARGEKVKEKLRTLADKSGGDLDFMDGLDPSIDSEPMRLAKDEIKGLMRPGKPYIKISADAVELLARINCSKDDIAHAFGVSTSTIDRKFRDPDVEEAFERGKAKGRISVRMLQQKIANSGANSAAVMAIHISKHVLGETDKAALEITGKGGGPIAMTFSALLQEIDGQSRLLPVADVPELEHHSVIDVTPTVGLPDEPVAPLVPQPEPKIEPEAPILQEAHIIECDPLDLPDSELAPEPEEVPLEEAEVELPPTVEAEPLDPMVAWAMSLAAKQQEN